ncbi:hypothetical protein [Streptomyces palmae]|uniref:hypothetical protein n=1 Tax=Streptomyces palmae TaxID=1701085 RepID=UPI001ADFDE13
MAISGAGAATAGEPGYALLIAAGQGGKQGKQRVMDAAAALPALAAVPPAVLLGTPGGASVVQLVDPTDPQTVLTHLRTAAAHPGPVLVYLAGRLVVDTKQHLPHLALAHTTARTARYSALPWHWLAAELGHRVPGSTTVLADLVADEAAWARLIAVGPSAAEHLAAGLRMYGVVAPLPAKRRLAVPHYSRALAALLRGAPGRPPLDRLHEQAATEAGLGTSQALLLAVEPGGGVPVGEPGLWPGGGAPVGGDPVEDAGIWPPGAGLVEPLDAVEPMDWVPPAAPMVPPAAPMVPPALGAPVEDAWPGGAWSGPAGAAAAGEAPVAGGPEAAWGPSRPDVPPPGGTGADTWPMSPDPEPHAVAAPVALGPAVPERGTEPDAASPSEAAAGQPEEAEPVAARGAGADAPAEGPDRAEGDAADAAALPEVEAGGAEPAAGVEEGPVAAPERDISLSKTGPGTGSVPPGADREGEPRTAEDAGSERSAPDDGGSAQPVPGNAGSEQPVPGGAGSAPPVPGGAGSERSGPEDGGSARSAPDDGASARSVPGNGGSLPPVSSGGASARSVPGGAASAPPLPVTVPKVVPPRRRVPDPHASILEAARAGRHSEAAAMAATWEQEAMRAAGPSSPAAIHWLEVRADLSRLAGDPDRACELWMAAARMRLGNQEPPEHPDVEAAADRAHHQWQQIQDRDRAVRLAPMLMELRRQVPGKRPGALEAVERRTHLLRADQHR